MKYLKLIPSITIIIISLFAIMPFFTPGLFTIHDNTQVERIFEMSKSLKDGLLPVRWVSDLGFGYGYPIFNFYAPFAYYLGGFLILLGINLILATKAVIVFPVILAGFFMYLLSKEFWGKTAGIVSASFYILAPYNAVNIYVRGDLGETWAYAFIPLIFYGFISAFKKKKLRYSLISLFGFAFLILSHNLTAMMLAPFIFAFLIILFFINERKKDSIIFLLVPLVLSLLIASFYWIPVFLEMKYTNVLSQIGKTADFRNHFLCPVQLWDSPWGYGGSAPGCIDGLSVKLGKLHVIFSLLAVFSFFFLFKTIKKSLSKVLFIFFTLSLLISFILSLEVSRPIWEIVKPMSFFQYPWRFLLAMSFFSSLITGILFQTKLLNEKIKIIFASFLILAVIFIYGKNFKPQFELNYPQSYYTDSIHLAWNTSNLSSEYMPVGFKKPESKMQNLKSKMEILKGSGKISILESKTGYAKAKVDLSDNSLIRVNIAYFPAWKLYVNGKGNEYKKTDQGLELNLKKGTYLIELKFVQTLIEQISNLIALTGLAVILAGIIYGARKKIL